MISGLILKIGMCVALAFDAGTTQSLIGRGGYEIDPVYGRHPGIARQVLTTAGFGALAVVLLGKTERSKRLRWPGRVAALGIIGSHLVLGYNNATICTHGCGRKR